MLALADSLWPQLPGEPHVQLDTQIFRSDLTESSLVHTVRSSVDPAKALASLHFLADFRFPAAVIVLLPSEPRQPPGAVAVPLHRAGAWHREWRFAGSRDHCES